MRDSLKAILAISAILIIAAVGIYSYSTFRKVDTKIVPINSSVEKAILAKGDNEIVSLGYLEPNTDFTENRVVFSSAQEFLNKIPKEEKVYIGLVEKYFYLEGGQPVKPYAIEKVYLAGPFSLYKEEYEQKDYRITERTTESITFYYSNEGTLGGLIIALCALLGAGVVCLFFLSRRPKFGKCQSSPCAE